MEITSEVKEGLVDELQTQARERDIHPLTTRAHRIRRLGGALEVVLEEGEGLLARRVIVDLGRSGDFRRLKVPGEDLDKVYNRLHDPEDFRGKDALVVGGAETAR